MCGSQMDTGDAGSLRSVEMWRMQPGFMKDEVVVTRLGAWFLTGFGGLIEFNLFFCF